MSSPLGPEPGRRRPEPPDEERITLRSDDLEVVLLPHKGADVYSIVDRPSGIDVLFKTPWGWRDPRLLPSTVETRADWLAHYPGGWQQLVPNAGPERVVDGVTRGFHGESATVGWTVEAVGATSAALTVNLLSAPLWLRREIRLVGPDLEVIDTVLNTSPDPVEVTWLQHPAFGAPFADAQARIATGARTFITDAEQPGTRLPADSVFRFPDARDLHGSEVDLRVVPGEDEPRAVFGALTDFEEPWYSISSPSAGFGIRVEWDAEIYPHAWFWQECHGTEGFPWFRRAYAIAIEPANVLPGEGVVGRWERGRAPVLAGGEARESLLRLSRIPLD